MSANNTRSFRLYKWLGAIVSFLWTFIVYARTAQISVPFWDCGEFIATSYCLGVPHPPGAPLLNLIGRIVAILPIPGLSVAHKLNIMSSFFCALAIMVLYLVIYRVMTKWFEKEPSPASHIISFASGVCGAVLAGFGSTYWSNAVETEVYGFAMLLTALLAYLSLVWYDQRNNPKSDKLVVLMAFLLYLGVAIHMTVMIMLPPVFLFLIFNSARLRKSFVFWFTWAVLFSVATEFTWFLWAISIGLIVTLVGSLVASDEKKRVWRLGFFTVAIALIAFSINLYTIIRSRHQPPIDENDPETIEQYKDYMDRKQYGQESMWVMIFHRKASWANQFGRHIRMGFWGFFEQQFSDPSVSLGGLIPFLLGMIGVVYQFIRDKRRWIILFLSLLISTLGLLIYLNFSDGTRGVQLEVRDRDYFYTPGFMFFGMFIGIGFGAILTLFNRLREDAQLPSALSYLASAIVMLVPIIPLKTHYYTHDRSRNWIPYDYAYNILMSCDKNAVLFTNGDNDTFPLWFIQIVENIRSDVRIANLSLLNTDWYIKQLKHQLKIPITMSDEQISRLRPYRDADGNIVRVQDIMVRHIIDNATITRYPDGTEKWDPPIFFAVTVSPENKLEFSPYLAMEGLVYRLSTQKVPNQVNIGAMRHNLFDVYLYRGLNDTTIYKDENSSKLIQNYTTAFMTLAIALSREKRDQEAIQVLERAEEILPYDWRVGIYLANLYSNIGDSLKFETIVTRLKQNPGDGGSIIYRYLAEMYMRANKTESAIATLEEGFRAFPDDKELFKTLLTLYNITQQQQKMEDLVAAWNARHADDKQSVPPPITPGHTEKETSEAKPQKR